MAGLIVMRPFLDQVGGKVNQSSGVYDSLLAERERLLSSIEELDLDLDLKKISPSEHALDRNLLLSQAADVLKKLDRYSKPKGSQKGKAKKTKADDLEKMIQERRKKLGDENAVYCSSCGKTIKAGAQFCSHCGNKQ
jgi:hypothetical protein